LAPVERPDCINDAVEKPDIAGPTSAIGTIKHPERSTLSAVNKNNLFIIESPRKILFIV
jgi:hypothetical protein